AYTRIGVACRTSSAASITGSCAGIRLLVWWPAIAVPSSSGWSRAYRHCFTLIAFVPRPTTATFTKVQRGLLTRCSMFRHSDSLDGIATPELEKCVGLTSTRLAPKSRWAAAGGNQFDLF